MKLSDDVARKFGYLLDLRVLKLGKSLSLIEYNKWKLLATKSRLLHLGDERIWCGGVLD